MDTQPLPAAPTPTPTPPVTPQNPAASAPPPAPASPAVALPVPGEESDAEDGLEELSPLKVLRQAPSTSAPRPSFSLVNPPGSPAAPAPAAAPVSVPINAPAPAPVPPATPPPAPAPGSPAETFILPQPNAFAAPTPPPAPVAPPASVSIPVRSVPAQPKPLPPQAVPPLGADPLPAAKPKAAAAPRARRHFSVPLLAGAGLVVVLAILAGSGYVLASGGSRLPFIYTYLSGLPTSGVDVAAKAKAYVASHASYQADGTISIKNQEAPAPTALPSDGSSVTDKVTSISTSISADEPMLYTVSNGNQTGKASLTMNALAPVSLYLAKKGGTSGDWNFQLPSNAVTPYTDVPNADIKQTLLYPALMPIPLTQILSSFKAETGYKKVEGKNIAYYQYGVDASPLASVLPDGAAFKSATGEAYYDWGTGAPLQVGLTATFDYQGATYSFQEVTEVSNWNKSLATGKDSDMDVILAGEATPADESGQQFVPQLGVPLAAVPNSLVSADAFTAITPSGQSISAVTDTITAVPPLPAVPATADAIQRDTQRKADLADLQTALEAYKKDTGSYPKAADLQQTVSSTVLFSALVPTYLTAMPVDPLQGTYWYEYLSTDGTSYTLRSVAEDTTDATAKPGKAFSYFELTNQ